MTTDSIRPTSLALCASFAIALASPLAASAEPSSESDWSAAVRAGSTIVIENPHGTISVRRSHDGNASLRALETAPAWRDSSAIAIAPFVEGSTITLCTALPDVADACAPGEGANVASDATNARLRGESARSEYRVDEVLDVPAGVRVVARGIEGSIVVEGAPSSIDAATVDGDIRVAAAAELGVANASPTSMTFRTKNGSISIDAPANAKFVLRASAPNGRVANDFATVGAASDAAVIDAETDDGSISLTKRT